MKYVSLFAGLALCLSLTGCVETTQTTSGKDYLSGYQTAPQIGKTTTDAEVRAIADVEPQLRFPARIGLAKVYNGQISNLSEVEATQWSQAQQQLGLGFGEFVPVSPLVAEMVYTPSSNPQDIVRKIRLGAARQHLDAVLIYEVFSETSEEKLPSAVANWTIIGAYFVPSEHSKTVGYANALLLDVRNGYPYGTATATATKEDTYTVSAQYGKQRKQQNNAQIAAAVNLIPKVTNVFTTLQKELSSAPATQSEPSEPSEQSATDFFNGGT